MEKKIKHQSIELNWTNPSLIKNPKTLVLGSFNPYESEDKSVDYYYGRSSNHFWRTISTILNIDEDYFFNKQFGLQRKEKVMQERFCCLDVIDSIILKAENQLILDNYIKKEIFSNFMDQKIWLGTTNYKKKAQISFSRIYNQRIIDLLKDSKTIKKVIHTMGENRITEFEVKPKELKLNENGFSSFFDQVKSICHLKGIQIIYESWSPSNYAVKNGSTSKENLRNWIENHLL